MNHNYIVNTAFAIPMLSIECMVHIYHSIPLLSTPYLVYILYIYSLTSRTSHLYPVFDCTKWRVSVSLGTKLVYLVQTHCLQHIIQLDTRAKVLGKVNDRYELVKGSLLHLVVLVEFLFFFLNFERMFVFFFKFNSLIPKKSFKKLKIYAASQEERAVYKLYFIVLHTPYSQLLKAENSSLVVQLVQVHLVVMPEAWL